MSVHILEYLNYFDYIDLMRALNRSISNRYLHLQVKSDLSFLFRNKDLFLNYGNRLLTLCVITRSDIRVTESVRFLSSITHQLETYDHSDIVLEPNVYSLLYSWYTNCTGNITTLPIYRTIKWCDDNCPGCQENILLLSWCKNETIVFHANLLRIL